MVASLHPAIMAIRKAFQHALHYVIMRAYMHILKTSSVRENIIGTYATDQARGQRLTRRTGSILQSEAASTEIQPPLPDSIANQLPVFGCCRIDQQPCEAQRSAWCHCGAVYRSGDQAAGAASGDQRPPRPPGLLDLGLGTWGVGEMGIERAAEASCSACSCQKLHNCNCD